MYKIGQEKRFTFATRAVRMPKFIFLTGLKFECEFHEVFHPFESSSPVLGWEFQPGLKPSSCDR